jgi:hypothetical protein
MDMARDFEDLHNIDDLNDDELRDLVRTHLAGSNAVDADNISVSVEDGVVRLAGRVGTEEELRVAERIVSDVLGIEQIDNQMVVDALRRPESSEDIEEHLATESESEGLLLGDRAVPFDDEDAEVRDDLDSRLFGTTDVQKAIADGTAWIPPESPTPEGRDSEAR